MLETVTAKISCNKIIAGNTGGISGLNSNSIEFEFNGHTFISYVPGSMEIERWREDEIVAVSQGWSTNVAQYERVVQINLNTVLDVLLNIIEFNGKELNPYRYDEASMKPAFTEIARLCDLNLKEWVNSIYPVKLDPPEWYEPEKREEVVRNILF